MNGVLCCRKGHCCQKDLVSITSSLPRQLGCTRCSDAWLTAQMLLFSSAQYMQMGVIKRQDDERACGSDVQPVYFRCCNFDIPVKQHLINSTQ